MQHVYDHSIWCTHYKDPENTTCIKGEYCSEGHMVPLDLETIQAGFNLYQVLQILIKTHPEHPSLDPFIRDENEYLFLLEKEQQLLANLHF